MTEYLLPKIQADKPKQRNWLKMLVILTCLGLFVAYTVLVMTKPISQDEGVFLTIGKYLNHGWLPYRDLVDHKPPAIYFLFAALFKIFGPSLWVAKIALILNTLGVSILIGKIGARLKSGSGWYAATVFLFLMTQFEGNYLIAEPFLLLPLLLSWWLLLRHKNSSRWLIIAGMAAAIAVLYKQTAIFSVVPLLVVAFTASKKTAIFFLIGALMPLALFVFFCISTGILVEAWHQVVILTLTSYPRESLPFVLQALRPNFYWTLPIWLLFLFSWRGHLQQRKVLLALVFLPAPFLFFRHYPHYWIQILPFVAMVVGHILSNTQNNRRLVPIVVVATLVFCLTIGLGKVVQDGKQNFTVLTEQLSVAKLLSQESPTRVLAENQYTGFYFLLPQKPLNRFLYITEVTDTDQAEQRTVDDLQNGQNILILWPLDPQYAYAKTLQRFITDHTADKNIFPSLGMRILESTSQ